MAKVSKASVDYRRHDIPGVECGDCVMFRAPHGCTLIAGSIDARFVCNRWFPAAQPTPTPRRLSGNAREDAAAGVAFAVGAVWAAAETGILQALAYWAAKAVTGRLLANLGLRRLRQAVTAILHQAEQDTRALLSEASRAIRADAERVIREDLASIGVPAGGEPPGPLAPGRLRPPAIPAPLVERAVAQALSGPAAAEWRLLPSQLHAAGLNALRDVDDIYRQVVAEAMTHPGLSRLQAAQRALDKFAEAGITGFADAAGRNWDLAAYVEMATRTAASRMHLALQLGAMGPAGFDLVIVTHPPLLPACPKCLPYIGHVLSISGMTPTGIQVSVTGADGAVRTAEVVGSVAEARAHGWGHPSCRCSLIPFVDGAGFLPLAGTAQGFIHGGRPASEHVPPPDSKRRYEAEQALRAHERAVRHARRMAAAATTAQARRHARAHLARAQARLEAHARDTGILRQRQREKINRAR